MVLSHDKVHDGGVGVADHRFPGQWGICRGGPGEEESEEVGNLRDGADRGARVVARGLLLYRDYGAQAVYALDRRFLQHSHEMLGVWGKGVHVAALTLCIDGVEGERRFAASAYSGDYHQLAARDVHIDIPQVVGPGAAHFYECVFIHKK